MFSFFRRNRSASENPQPASQPVTTVDPLVVIAELKQWHMDRIPAQRERYERIYKLWQSGNVSSEVVQSAYAQWMKNVMAAAKYDGQLKAQQSNQPVQQQLTLF